MRPILDSLKKNGNEIAASFFKNIAQQAEKLTNQIDIDAVGASLKEAKTLYDNRGISKQARKDALARYCASFNPRSREGSDRLKLKD